MIPSKKWSSRFLELAGVVATWSKDPSTQVGCVIVDSSNRVVSLGFNGPPKGVSDVITSRDQKLKRTIHAEANALHFAHRDVTGCTLYVTHPPCAHCAAHIIQRGISTVVFGHVPDEFRERWREDIGEAYTLLTEARVLVIEDD